VFLEKSCAGTNFGLLVGLILIRHKSIKLSVSDVYRTYSSI